MSVVLNRRLIESQGLVDCEVKQIEDLHVIRETLFDNVRGLNPNDADELEMIRHAAVELRDLEFAMQRAWRFEEIKNRHTWWYQIPHCSCPYMDNMDMVGVNEKWSNGTCPVHDPSPYPKPE